MFRAAHVGLRGAVRNASTEAGAAAKQAAGQVDKGAYDAAGAARSAYGAARGNTEQALGRATGNTQEALGRATGNASSEYGYARGNAEEALGKAAGDARTAYGQAKGSARETLGEAEGLAQQMKGEAQGAASSLSHRAHGAAAAASGQAQGAASSLAGQAKGAAYNAEHSVKDAAHQAKQTVTPPSGPVVIGKPTIRRPIGSVRGGMMGFLLGFGIASSYGYYYLLKEYNAASNLMLASVEELQSSTDKVRSEARGTHYNVYLTLFLHLAQITTHLQRLNKLEADLKSLSSGSASKSDYEKNRSEMKRIIDGLHDEVLDVKKRVVGTLFRLALS